MSLCKIEKSVKIYFYQCARFSVRHKEDNMKLDKKKFLSEVDGILHADYGTDLASANKNAAAIFRQNF